MSHVLYGLSAFVGVIFVCLFIPKHLFFALFIVLPQFVELTVGTALFSCFSSVVHREFGSI
jgi:hypothetical protein